MIICPKCGGLDIDSYPFKGKRVNICIQCGHNWKESDWQLYGIVGNTVLVTTKSGYQSIKG